MPDILRAKGSSCFAQSKMRGELVFVILGRKSSLTSVMVFLDYKVCEWPVTPVWEYKIHIVPEKPSVELGSEGFCTFFDS